MANSFKQHAVMRAGKAKQWLCQFAEMTGFAGI
jgi:hypothetical protein